MAGNVEKEEIIYYQLVMMEDRLNKREEVLNKTQEAVEKLLLKAEALLNTIEQKTN